MTRRRAPTLAGLGVAAALAAALSMHARVAHAYTFIEEMPDDPCARARSFDPQDTTLTAQKARRACRLEAFEQRLASERRKTLASEQDARDAWVDKWMGATQSARVINPLAIEAYAGYGITSYGLVFSWTVLRQLELAARIGQRADDLRRPVRRQRAATARARAGTSARAGSSATAISRPSSAPGSRRRPRRWRSFTPNAQGGDPVLQGNGRANSVNASAGLQLAVSYLRLSLEYVFEYQIYTGANLNDMQKTPSEDLRLVWEDSLNQDRHGVRFQVGFAF